jgi:cardiolipin hydrolase
MESEAYFSPGNSCRNAIIHHLDAAVSNLKICVFTISDDLITESIIKARKRGVNILILTDNDKLFDLGSDIKRLSGEDITIRIDNTSNHMHHKFMIVDDRVLINGSYNWTRSAANFNQENIIVTHEPGLVKLFQQEFDKLWKEMIPFHAKLPVS